MRAAALPRPRLRAARAPAGAAVGAWALLVVAAWLIGRHRAAIDPLVHLSAPPLVGQYDVRVGPRVLPLLALAVASVWWGPVLARRLPWRALLAAVAAAAVAWPVALAATDGLAYLPAPLETSHEYLADVPRVGDAGAFLRSFTDELPDHRTHVRGHPPGMVLLLDQMDDAGLGGAVPALVLILGVAALAPLGALAAARELAGEERARAAAPFLVLAPAAVWVATSADALFAGVAAAGIALFVLATGRDGARRIVLAVTAGVVLGLALMLSYGVAPLGALVLIVAGHRRALTGLLAAASGVAAVAVAFGAAGFWWWDGLAATHDEYHAGIASIRPPEEFAVISLAAFALAVGPAAFAGLARLRDRALWLLPAGAAVAVASATISSLSRGETERIWLPFVPWLLLACAALPRPRPWLALQVGLACAIQVGVRSAW